MEKQLNKSILITGCSTGIGAALVMEFLKEGFLVFGSIRDKKLEAPLKIFGHKFSVSAKKSIESSGGEVVIVKR